MVMDYVFIAQILNRDSYSNKYYIYKQIYIEKILRFQNAIHIHLSII